jgi:hypothetical protein
MLMGYTCKPLTRPKVVVMCSNNTRFTDAVYFIKHLDDESINKSGVKRVFVYYDELHNYIENNNLRSQIEEINNLDICKGVLALTATPDKIWNDTPSWSNIHLLDLSNHNDSNIEKLDWEILSSNPNAIHLLGKNPDKIDWSFLSSNPNAIHLLEQNPTKIDWEYLSSNPNAIDLLEQNPTKIDWYALSFNPNAIHLLEQNPYKINWFSLSGNPNAIQLLEKNRHKIIWQMISKNSSIFKEMINYEFLFRRMDILREELMMKSMHPQRL